VQVADLTYSIFKRHDGRQFFRFCRQRLRTRSLVRIYENDRACYRHDAIAHAVRAPRNRKKLTIVMAVENGVPRIAAHDIWLARSGGRGERPLTESMCGSNDMLSATYVLSAQIISSTHQKFRRQSLRKFACVHFDRRFPEMK
jgi:hypothetical protein